MSSKNTARVITSVGSILLSWGLLVAAAGPAAAAPTCADVLDVAVHGQHVVTDYVTGAGHVGSVPPPGGSHVGQIVGAARGAAVPGGPAAGGHFEAGVAPGASFCTGSKSPGLHL